MEIFAFWQIKRINTIFHNRISSPGSVQLRSTSTTRERHVIALILFVQKREKNNHAGAGWQQQIRTQVKQDVLGSRTSVNVLFYLYQKARKPISWNGKTVFDMKSVYTTHFIQLLWTMFSPVTGKLEAKLKSVFFSYSEGWLKQMVPLLCDVLCMKSTGFTELSREAAVTSEKKKLWPLWLIYYKDDTV